MPSEGLWGTFRQLFHINRKSDTVVGLVPMGVQGRPQYPDTDINSLMTAQRRNELVFACINKLAMGAIDPTLRVEQKSRDGDWMPVEGHPLTRLMMKPNSMMDSAAFLKAWIVSEQTTGVFYAEIVRSPAGAPIQLWPLDPRKVFPIPGEGEDGQYIVAYEYRDGLNKVRLEAKDVIAKQLYDQKNKYQGLSPLAVAMGSVDADSAQTDYVRAFFNNAGMPSGLIKVKGRTITPEESQYIKEQWLMKYGRAWGKTHDVAVLDEGADYEKVGANLNELESDSMRGQTESRICMVFDVPPMLVGAKVGLEHSTYSNMEQAQKGLWDNKLSPMFKEYRSFLTWRLLPEFVDIERIYAEIVRLNWDMSQVAALQEDVEAMQKRARDNFRAGIITLNEARAAVGEKPDQAGEYYLRTANLVAVPFGVFPEATPKPVIDSTATDVTQLDNGNKRMLLPRSRKSRAERATTERDANIAETEALAKEIAGYFKASLAGKETAFVDSGEEESD